MNVHSINANQRKAVEELHLLAVGNRAFQRFEVRKQVLDEERADGNDAEQRVQLTPDEAGALPRTQWLDTAVDHMRGWGRSRGFDSCHEEFELLVRCGLKSS